MTDTTTEETTSAKENGARAVRVTNLRQRVSKQPLGRFSEIGVTGLRRNFGRPDDEFLDQLRPADRAEVYREMKRNDPVIGAALSATRLLMLNVDWSVEDAADDRTAEQAGMLVRTSLEDMSWSWQATLDEIISFVPHGFSFHEIVYKRRTGPSRQPGRGSQFNDGMIGWRKFAPRAQHSLHEWMFDDHGGVRAFVQREPNRMETKAIPIQKGLLFRTRHRLSSPEGQALALDTPVPTPNGWTTMGEIGVGDMVYGSDGSIRYVTARSDVWEDRPCYEVVFSTGESVVADANHLWSVTTLYDRQTNKEARTVTTEDIYQHLQGDYARKPSLSVGETPVLDAPAMALPIPPYILGYWLGDGSTHDGSIGCSQEDYDHLKDEAEAAGFEVSEWNSSDNTCYISGLKQLLRRFDLYRNKHIPRRYLRAAPSQRLALLQGLMDSDGSTPTENCKATRYFGCDEQLVDQVQELTRTLGCKPRRRVASPAGKISNTPWGEVTQTKDCHQINVFCRRHLHRLPRKADQQHMMASDRCFNHYIEDVRPVASRDTVCIEVDAPDHQFLVGEGMVPTHNSVLRTVFVPWYRKKKIEEIEGIGIERDLAGMPKAWVPAEFFDESADADQQAAKNRMEDIVRSVRRDEQEGVLLPYETDEDGNPVYGMDLMNTGGQRQFNTNNIITRYDQRIAASMLADFVLLGHDAVGSFALSDSKTRLFSMALDSYLDEVAEVFNRHAIPRLLRLNGLPVEAAPELQHGDVETEDLSELGLFVRRLQQAGLAVFPDDALERELARRSGLPLDEIGEDAENPEEDSPQNAPPGQ